MYSLSGVPVPVDRSESDKYGHLMTDDSSLNEKFAELQGEIDRLKEYENIVKGVYGEDNICYVIFQDIPPAIVFVNRSLELVSGYSRDELLNFTYPDFSRIISPDIIDELFDRYRRRLDGELIPNNYELKVARKDGSIITFQTYIHRIEYNRKPAVVFMMVDITRLKESEKELRESREKYRMLFNRSPVSIFYYDRNLLITHFNDRFVELLRSSRELLWRFDMRNIPDRTVVSCLEMVLHGKNGYYKGPYRSVTSGAEIFVSLRTEPLFDDMGRVTGGAGIIEDLTRVQETEEALVRSEENFKEMIDRSPMAISVINRNGEIVYYNIESIKLFGFMKSEKVNIEAWFNDVYPDPEYRERVIIEWRNDYAETQRTRVTSGPKEFRVLCSDGITRSIEFYMVPVGEMNFLIMNDMTGRRRAEDELLKRKKLESLGIMAGGIAHDFNNILTAIVGNIDMVKMEVASQQSAHPLLESIERAAWRARDLTLQLLTFASGGEPVRRDSSVKGILSDSIYPVISNTGIEAVINIDDDLMEADVDEAQIIQALHNIIINSKEAMDSRGVIRVTAQNYRCTYDENLKPGGDYVKIAVEDTGSGINPSDAANIFDPFFTTKGSSSGLGLTVSYSIIRKHGGDIRVSPRSGGGTLCEVYLPAGSGKTPAQSVSQTAEIRCSGRLLVMDDEEIILEVMRRMLTRAGYDVSLARDGEEAMELYRGARSEGKPFDCVIMDLSIPNGMGGKDTIARLREYDPGVRAIVSSGYSNDPVMSRYAEYGFLGVSVKPYSFEDLRNEIRRVMIKDPAV